LAGAAPQTLLVSSQCSPTRSSCISGVLLLRKRRGKRRKQRRGKRRRRKTIGMNEQREKRGKGDEIPNTRFWLCHCEKGGGRATKRERTKKMKKIKGRRGRGRASELGRRLPPGAEGDGRPCVCTFYISHYLLTCSVI